MEDHSEGQVRAEKGLNHGLDGQVDADPTDLEEIKLTKLKSTEVFHRKYYSLKNFHLIKKKKTLVKPQTLEIT